MKPVEKVLERATGVPEMGSGWLVRCPLPDHGQGRGDRNPSVSVSEGDDGRALVRCKAGCGTEAIVAAWGLSMSDLFESRNELTGDNVARPGADGKKVFGHTYRDNAATLQRCTLEGYAEAKRLPVEYLKTLGLWDAKYQGSQALRIPYHSPDGSETAVRYRLALEKSGERPHGPGVHPEASGLAGLYSPECVEGVFSELRAEGVLRSLGQIS